MSHVDNDAAVRDRAYVLWELAGRPMGREHEFWAQASREIEGLPARHPGAEASPAVRATVGPEDESRDERKGELSAAELDKLKLAGAAQD